MAVQKLTDKSVAATKAEPGERVELWDEQTPGLCLRVSAKKSRTPGAPNLIKRVWIWRYRTADGRQPRLTLGDYSPRHSLKWAREEVEALRVKVRDPKADPAAERRMMKAAAKAQTLRTFDELADAYLKACGDGHWKPRNKKKRERTLADERGSLKRHIRPVLGKLRIDDITRREVRALLRGMVDAGISAQTNKAHQVIRQIFSYAISEERVAVNPAVGFLPLATQKPRVRTLSDDELKSFWKALEDPSDLRLPSVNVGEEGDEVAVGPAMRIILQLATLLLQRRGEITGMMTDELNLDQGLWLIPGERMKGGLPHLVPLPAEAVKLIRRALVLADEMEARKRKEGEKPENLNSRPVFPSPRGHGKSVLANSVTHAMKDITIALGIEGASPHDLRRTGSTALTSERLGVSPFIRSKVLGHSTDAGGGAAVSSVHYDANTYIAGEAPGARGMGSAAAGDRRGTCSTIKCYKDYRGGGCMTAPQSTKLKEARLAELKLSAEWRLQETLLWIARRDLTQMATDLLEAESPYAVYDWTQDATATILQTSLRAPHGTGRPIDLIHAALVDGQVSATGCLGVDGVRTRIPPHAWQKLRIQNVPHVLSARRPGLPKTFNVAAGPTDHVMKWPARFDLSMEEMIEEMSSVEPWADWWFGPMFDAVAVRHLFGPMERQISPSEIPRVQYFGAGAGTAARRTEAPVSQPVPLVMAKFVVDPANLRAAIAKSDTHPPTKGSLARAMVPLFKGAGGRFTAADPERSVEATWKRGKNSLDELLRLARMS